MPPPKAWLRDCATSRCMPFRYWDILDPYPRRTKLLSRLRPMPTVHYRRPYNAIPTNLLCVGSICGFGPDLLGIHTLSLAARCRTAANSGTLTKGVEKDSSSSWVWSCSHFCSQLRMGREIPDLFHGPLHCGSFQCCTLFGSQ